MSKSATFIVVRQKFKGNMKVILTVFLKGYFRENPYMTSK